MSCLRSRNKFIEIVLFAVMLLSTASFLQMFTLPLVSQTNDALDRQERPDFMNEDRYEVELPPDPMKPNAIVHHGDVIMFHEVPDVILPHSYQVPIRGLKQLPANFRRQSPIARDDFRFRLEPIRITGSDGLLRIREFQGSSWTGTLMQGAVVFFVQSSPNHYRRRMLQRTTWGSIREIEGWKLEVVFVVPTPRSSFQQNQLVEESNKYGDLLQFYDSKHLGNSSSLVMASLGWAVNHLPHDFYFASMTDDVFLNIAAVRDHIGTRANHYYPHGAVYTIQASDGSSVTSSEPQTLYCYESYLESEEPVRDSKLPRAVTTHAYNAPTWPPYCSEGLYALPIAFAREIHEHSLVLDATLPSALHDVLVTGILRRKTKRGDENISSATGAGEPTLLRVKALSRSRSTDLANFELAAENNVKSAWADWYERIRYRYHILTHIKPL